MNPSCIYNRQSKAVRALWNFLTSPTGAFLIAVSAILIGYYQFYISRPILKYTTETTEISSASGSDDFKIHINGKDYPKLYKTAVTLSNTGEDALAGSDVSSLGHDPIRIPIPPRVKILYYGINNAETSSDVSAKLIKTDNAIVIEFNYLNPDNQITVNMYSEDNYDKFEILGSAVNVNRITQAWSPEQTRKFIIGTIALMVVTMLLLGEKNKLLLAAVPVGFTAFLSPAPKGTPPAGPAKASYALCRPERNIQKSAGRGLFPIQNDKGIFYPPQTKCKKTQTEKRKKRKGK